MRRLLLVALLLSACSAPPLAPTPELPEAQAPEASAFPAEGTVHRDSLGLEPTVVPFVGRAGQEVRVRAVAESGPEPDLCLASAEAWARIIATGPMQEAPPDDLAGDEILCARPDASGAATVAEVLPRTGAYVLVAEGPGDPGAIRLDGLVPEWRLPMLASGEAVSDSLRPPEARDGLGLRDDTGLHLVAGRVGERLTVTVEGDGFEPYVEVGSWAGRAFYPFVGETPERGAPEATAETAVLQMRLPADGVYAVRVVSLGGDGHGYRVRADLAPAEDWALRFPSNGDPADRYALIAAVSDYPGRGADPFQDDLFGPRADADAIRTLLVDDLGFAPENVVVLRDAEVTREALAEGFRRHLGQAGASGAAFFHYAGHGVQLPAEALPEGRAEPDGLDEALALWGRGDQIAYLLDHELGALAEALPAEHVVLALDNCHSGDGTRGDGASGGAVRRLAYREVSGRIATPEAVIGDTNAGAERHVLLSAARDNQPSLELDGLAPDGGRAGVFTTALVRALRSAPPEATFADVIAALRPGVERQTEETMEEEGFRPQSPQVEGAQAGVSVRAALGPRGGR